MNVLILIDNYFPKENANAICIQNLINQFSYNKYFVICEGLNNKSEFYEYNKVNIYTIKRIRSRNNYVTKFLNFMKLLINYNISFKKANLFFQKAKKIIAEERIDIVIAVCRPFYTSFSSYKLKIVFPALKVYNIFFDSPCSTNYKVELFNRIWKLSTKRFFLKLNKKNINFCFMKYSLGSIGFLIDSLNNIKIFDIPCFIPQKTDEKFVNNGLIVYSGTLDKNYRNPDKILRFILNIIIKNDLNMNISCYASGCEDLLKRIKEDYPQIINYEGFINNNLIQSVYKNASFFINIGNHNLKQLPSKIFTYFSTGKPVINFYFDDDDLSLPYFEEYGNCITINVNRIENSEEALVKFLKSYKIIKYDELSTKFFSNLPYSYKEIIDNI